MFKLSIHVSNKKLADTLESLHELTDTAVEVSFEGSKLHPAATTTVVTGVQAGLGGSLPYVTSNTATTRRSKKRKLARTHKSLTGMYGYEAAQELIGTYGVPPFSRASLITKGQTNNVSSYNINRGIQLLIAKGELQKVRPGIYQRTPAAWGRELSGNGSASAAATAG